MLNAVETHEEPPSLCVTRTSPTPGRTAPLPEVPATPPRRGRLLSLQDAAGSGPAQHLSLRGGQSLLGLAHLAKQKRLELYWSFAFLHIADTLGGPTSTCSPPRTFVNAHVLQREEGAGDHYLQLALTAALNVSLLLTQHCGKYSFHFLFSR